MSSPTSFKAGPTITTTFACGHAEYTMDLQNKAFWSRMKNAVGLNQKSSELCRNCKSLKSNRRAAPPARAAAETLAAINTGETKGFLRILKNSSPELTAKPIKEEEVTAALEDIEKFAMYWKRTHAEHVTGIPLALLNSGQFGPNVCLICAEILRATQDPSYIADIQAYRYKDAQVPDQYFPFRNLDTSTKLSPISGSMEYSGSSRHSESSLESLVEAGPRNWGLWTPEARNIDMLTQQDSEFFPFPASFILSFAVVESFPPGRHLWRADPDSPAGQVIIRRIRNALCLPETATARDILRLRSLPPSLLSDAGHLITFAIEIESVAWSPEDQRWGMENAEIHVGAPSIPVPSEPEEPAQIDPKTPEGQVILKKITQYLSLPTDSSHAQVLARLGGSDGDMEIDLNTAFIRSAPSWGPGHRHRLLASLASRQARIEFDKQVNSIRWAEKDFEESDELVITATEKRWFENQLNWREPTLRKAKWVRKVSRLGEVVEGGEEQCSFLSWLLGFSG